MAHTTGSHFAKDLKLRDLPWQSAASIQQLAVLTPTTHCSQHTHTHTHTLSEARLSSSSSSSTLTQVDLVNRGQRDVLTGSILWR